MRLHFTRWHREAVPFALGDTILLPSGEYARFVALDADEITIRRYQDFNTTTFTRKAFLAMIEQDPMEAAATEDDFLKDSEACGMNPEECESCQ